MIRECTRCGKEFEHPAKRGRPPSFCGPICRDDARKDPQRLCQTCGGLFYMGDTKWPYHCSDECHETKKTLCLHCLEPAIGMKFCSGECVAAHYPLSKCRQCDGLVPPPSDPPYNKMPNYCSEDCRQAKHASMNPLRPGKMQEYSDIVIYFENFIPLNDLPHRRGTWYMPIQIPYHNAPPLPTGSRLSAHVANSIVWWNHYLVTADHTQIQIAHLGRTGWGGADTPTGCLPLYKCWPWITPKARNAFDSALTMEYWMHAGKLRKYTRAQVEKKMSTLRSEAEEWVKGSWPDRKEARYAYHDPVERSALLRDISFMYDYMLAEPEPHLLYPTEYDEVTSTAFQEYYATLNDQRMTLDYEQSAKQLDLPVNPASFSWESNMPNRYDRFHTAMDQARALERERYLLPLRKGTS